LQVLLEERFQVRHHRETREFRVYELAIGKTGAKVQPAKDGATPAVGSGLHFRGNMQRFADLLAVQLSILASDDPTRPGRASGPPVTALDRTGLSGNYDFAVDIRPEPGSDMFTLWQRVLQDRLGLTLESRKGAVEVLVVDSAERVPATN